MTQPNTAFTSKYLPSKIKRNNKKSLANKKNINLSKDGFLGGKMTKKEIFP
jgi:hypothetical protein